MLGAGAGRGSDPGRSCCCGNRGGSQLLIPTSKRTEKKDFIPEAVARRAASPSGVVSRDLALTPRSPRCSRPSWSSPGGIFRAMGPCWTLLCDRVALCSLLLCANSGGQAQKRRYSPGNQVLPPAVPPVPLPLGIPCSQLQESLGKPGETAWKGCCVLDPWELSLRDGAGSRDSGIIPVVFERIFGVWDP